MAQVSLVPAIEPPVQYLGGSKLSLVHDARAPLDRPTPDPYPVVHVWEPFNVRHPQPFDDPLLRDRVPFDSPLPYYSPDHTLQPDFLRQDWRRPDRIYPAAVAP